MKKRALNFIMLLFLIIFFSDKCLAYNSANSMVSNTFIVDRQGVFNIDISDMPKDRLEILKNSIYKLQKFGEIKDYQENKNTMTLSLNDDTIKNLEINNNGLFIKHSTESYILELNSMPLIRESEVTISASSLESEKDKIQQEHEEAINNIISIRQTELANMGFFARIKYFFSRTFNKITGNAVVEDNPIEIKAEFYNVFNGLAIDGLTKEELKTIKENGYAKNIYINRKVYANLFDSGEMINATQAWNLDADGGNCIESAKECLTGKGIGIAIIDTGIDYTHPDLGGCFGEGCKVIGGYDFVNVDSDPMDDNGHGTHCAGISAGNGALKGIAPDAKLYAYKVLDSGGSGSMSDVILGIERAVDPNKDGDFSDKVDVISLSLGGSGNPDDAVSKAVDNAADAGVIVVVAAGNDGPSEGSIGSPGTARKAITVGAICKDSQIGNNDYCENQIASFSSRGPVLWDGGSMIKPDIVAPGVDICSAQYDSAWDDKKCYDEKHVAISGTSMATPHVAGAVALLKQARQDITPDEIKSLIKLSAVDLGFEANTQGNGKISITNALLEDMVISGDLNFGRIDIGEVQKTKKITIKNIGKNTLNIALEVGQAISEDDSKIDAVSLDKTNLAINSGESAEVVATLNFAEEYDGSYYGKILMNKNSREYSIDYTFSRYSQLNLELNGEHYPNFYAHRDDLNTFYSNSQGWETIGNSATLYVRSGKYTIYAINDFVNKENPLYYPETDEYILSDSITVPASSIVSFNFDLQKARKFKLRAKAPNGNDLYLFEWVKGINVYKNKFDSCENFNGDADACRNNNELYCYVYYAQNYPYCYTRIFSSSFSDPMIGDREIYLSNSVANGLESDVLLKYLGADQNE